MDLTASCLRGQVRFPPYRTNEQTRLREDLPSTKNSRYRVPPKSPEWSSQMVALEHNPTGQEMVLGAPQDLPFVQPWFQWGCGVCYLLLESHKQKEKGGEGFIVFCNG